MFPWVQTAVSDDAGRAGGFTPTDKSTGLNPTGIVRVSIDGAGNLDIKAAVAVHGAWKLPVAGAG